MSATTQTDGAIGSRVRIPFNRPSIQGREIEYIRTAVEHGHTSAEGPFSTRVASMLRDELDACDVLLTTSCTAALEMSALLVGVGPGDTVVVPSFGFVTTALAFARAGARIVFGDIEERTLGLDPDRLAEIMDGSVRAVVPIHYAGVGCDVEGIQRVLERWPGAALVEDNAHGLFGRYRGRPLGSFGRFSTLSFHETKNFICGEGGALVVNREADVRRANVLYHKGTNRREFLLGEVDKYTWQDTGSSFGLADVLPRVLVDLAEEVLVSIGALVEENVSTGYVGFVVDDERAALAADEVLRLVEAQRCEAAEAPERSPAVPTEQPVGVVLDQLGSGPAFEHRADSLEVARDARVVDRDDSTDRVVHDLGEVSRVEAEGLVLDVTEQDARTLACEGECGRDESERGDDDGVAGPDVECHRGHLECGRARRGEQHVGRADLFTKDVGHPRRERARRRGVPVLHGQADELELVALDARAVERDRRARAELVGPHALDVVDHDAGLESSSSQRWYRYCTLATRKPQCSR